MLSQITERKFIETYSGNGRKILTPLGFKEIEYVHKTIPYEKYRLKTESGIVLNCAENHVIILEDDSECYAKNSLNKSVKTINGIEKIIECEDLHIKENMYDLTLKEETELYYSNGILSHNSGKTVTTGIYLAWQTNFKNDMNIGICANKGSLAREFLNNVKEILYSLPMWMRQGVTVWNKSSIETELKMRVLTDVPSSDSFRGFSISLLVLDECAWIPSTKYYEMIDGMGPSQSALSWKKNIFLSTPNGMNHFYDLVKGARDRKKITVSSKEEIKEIKEKVLNIKEVNGEYIVTIDRPSNGYGLFETDWRNIPRFNKKGERISSEEFKESIVEKNGLVYFQQNFACSFIGSSHTLIDQEILKNLESSDYEFLNSNRLKIYKEPLKNHKYIMGVDPAKSGLDAFAVQVLDVTTFPFEQVASAQLFNENFQIMPEFINEWGIWYNHAYLIIENNEGAGTFIATLLQTEFEYDNLFFDKTYNRVSPTGKLNLEAGFRTTSKSRNLILEVFKLLMNNNKLILHDKATITELFTFIIKNNKFQADDGYHDDMIMSLCLCFVPFCNTRNFDDMKDLIQKLYNSNSTEEIDFLDYLVIGDFDDGVEIEENKPKRFDKEYQVDSEMFLGF